MCSNDRDVIKDDPEDVRVVIGGSTEWVDEVLLIPAW
jgi:hypothetical protein